MVLIDWAFSGIAAIGEEIAPLVVASLFFTEAPAEQARDLGTVVVDGYVAGLQEAGWSGDSELAHTGYVTSIAVRYGVGALEGLVPFLMNEQGHPAVEADFGKSMVEIADNLAATYEWIVDMADRVRRPA